MANTFSPVPVFKQGEPGFAAKLNELGKVLNEVIEHVNGCPARDTAEPQVTKPVPRKVTAAK